MTRRIRSRVEPETEQNEFLRAIDTIAGYTTQALDFNSYVGEPDLEFTPDQYMDALKTAHKHALTLGLEHVPTWIEDLIANF